MRDLPRCRSGFQPMPRPRPTDDLTTYGRSSGFCVDPIEKKPLDHFLRGTSVLSFGTADCNLACTFCQNRDISTSRETDTLADAASPDELAATAERLGCRSVAFTHNDPVIFLEHAVDTAIACRARGDQGGRRHGRVRLPRATRRALHARRRSEHRSQGAAPRRRRSRGLRPEAIGDRAACGARALRWVVEHARRAGLTIALLAHGTSADTSGDRSRVVGYRALAVGGWVPSPDGIPAEGLGSTHVLRPSTEPCHRTSTMT